MVGKSPVVLALMLTLMLAACQTNVAFEKASRFDEGTAAYDAGDYAGAYRIWSALAEEDDLAAMRNTAQLLRQGKGVDKDPQKAFKLYREAAEKGLVTAMANVADMFLSGEGTEKNPEAAAAWYARAATAGLSIAQMKLSEMYEQGVGVEKDAARSRALLERAARNGYAPAQAKMKAMGISLTEEAAVPAAPQNPDDPWRPKKDVKPAAAPLAAGRMASPGDPIVVAVASKMPPDDQTQMNAGFAAYAAADKARAFAAWRSVALRGNPEAQVRVGVMYERGEGVGQDMIEAYRWLKLAADQGQPQAGAEVAFVAAQLAPAERAIAESLLKTPPK